MSFWKYAGWGVAAVFGGAVAYRLWPKGASKNPAVDVNLPQLDPLLKQAQAVLANPASPAATSAATIAMQAVQAAQQVLGHPSTSAGAPPGTPAKAAQDAANQAASLAQQALAAAQDPATQQQAVDLANQAAQAAAQAQKAIFGG